MKLHHLLYIDILGFSALAMEGSPRINDLYEVITSLNALRDSGFKAIVFSDTILIYNMDWPDSKDSRQCMVMYLCEFVQDLQHRLIKRNIFFRAVLVKGEFTHYELNSIPCFYGPALIQAHSAEKSLKAIGLFMHTSIVEDSHIFKTRPFNEEYHFAYLTQSIHYVEEYLGGQFPIDKGLLEDSDLIYNLVPEVMHLQQVHCEMTKQADPRVREKYQATWNMFSQEYPKTTAFLAANNFSWLAICPTGSWSEVINKFPEDFSYAIESRVVF